MENKEVRLAPCLNVDLERSNDEYRFHLALLSNIGETVKAI